MNTITLTFDPNTIEALAAGIARLLQGATAPALADAPVTAPAVEPPAATAVKADADLTDLRARFKALGDKGHGDALRALLAEHGLTTLPKASQEQLNALEARIIPLEAH